MSKREVCFVDLLVLILTMELVMCWITSHYQKNKCLVSKIEMSDLLEMLLPLHL